MTSEIEAAVDRVRRVRRGESVLEVYGETPSEAFLVDNRVLVDAYLAMTSGEWLTAADSEGWWWHHHNGYPDVISFGTESEKFQEVHYIRTWPGGLCYVRGDGHVTPARGGRWQKTLGPFF